MCTKYDGLVFRLISILLFCLVLQSSSGVSKFMKTFLCIFLNLFHILSIFRYIFLDTFFCIFVGDFFSSYVCSLTNATRSPIHSF